MYHLIRAIQRDGYQINKNSYTCLTCSFIRRQVSNLYNSVFTVINYEVIYCFELK